VVRKVDLVVIGGGPGGYPAAIRAAQLGKKVLLVERHKLGGECLNYGCIPSKALIHVANVVKLIERAPAWGIDVSPAKVDVARLQAWKQSVVDKLVGGVAQLCKGNGVEVAFAEASFLDAKTVRTHYADGRTEDIEFGDAIIATGGRPTDLPAFRFDGKRVISTKEALELPSVPGALLVIGGGISGLEIGTFYAKLGTKVVIIELLEQLLPGMDPEVVRVIERHLRKLGVEYHTRSQGKAWREEAGQSIVEAETPDGPLTVHVDAILVTVGRHPNTDGLAADKAGVKMNAKGYVLVDKQLRTSNPHVFAIGDVVGQPFLAHKATMEGLTAAEVVGGEPVEVDYRAMPSAIFTDPEIATVGLLESQAAADGHAVKVAKVPFGAIGRALAEGESDGFVKLISDPESNVLLGGAIVGPDASNLISELALAIEMGATIEDLALTVHPHPTLPEAIMETAEAALGQAINVLNR
jgi:dihydrolipoamide dehydrogenase